MPRRPPHGLAIFGRETRFQGNPAIAIDTGTDDSGPCSHCERWGFEFITVREAGDH